MQGLRHLEYRGYDSAGLAAIRHEKGDAAIEIVKAVGEIKKLESALSRRDFSGVRTAVGHTRWATHGAPSAANSHPHPDCKGSLALVHNGIIENYVQLRSALVSEGHDFRSQTDTEAASHLIEKHYSGNAVEALQKAMREIRGSYAFAFVHKDHPGKVFFARNQSPLILGIGNGSNLIASDVPAVLAYTRNVIYLDDGDCGWISKDGFEIYNSGKRAERTMNEVSWSVEDAQKGGFPHFMLKEIFENPRAISETMLSRISLSPPYSSLEVPEEALRNAKRIHIVACGTSYHAGLVGKIAIESISGTPVQVDVASEQRYSFIDDDEVFVYITQSGETADTIACAREAKRRGKAAIAITNVVGSTITRECPYSIMTCAGPEKGVAATKTYTSQIVTLYILALRIAEAKGRLDAEAARGIVEKMRGLPRAAQNVLDGRAAIEKAAKSLAGASHVFFIGRGIGYPAALEGALKLKEISYINAEGYAAGELKHGPFALLSQGSAVVAVVPRNAVYDKMIGNLGEVRARGARIYAFSDDGEEVRQHSDATIDVPETDPLLSAVPMGIALQLLSYYVAKEMGCPIDKPRNLAKSVTVE